jgi:predicted CxxxxCH...CXXCH cytochrome family protein
LNNGAGTPIVCDTCHNGLGTNTLNHYNRANARTGLNALRVPPGDAAFPATYNAETGATSFDNATLSCSNASCHGGQATPSWQTGTLDVNTQCTSCHAFGAAQFNSYSSGEHDQEIHAAVGCLVCHNTTTLDVNHFTALSTPAMEGPASATIGGGSTLVTSYVPGGTPGTGTCNATCHPGDRDW